MSATNKGIKCSYTWSVENCGVLYYDRVEPCISSPLFITNVSGDLIKWQLSIMYYNNQQDKSIDFILQTLSTATSEIAVSFTVHLTNSEGKTATQQDKFDFECMDNNSSYVFHTTLEKDFGFKSGNNGSLQDFSLTIICDIFFELPVVVCNYGGDDNSTNCSTADGSKDFEKFEEFFESGKLSDVKIVAGGEEFLAHKVILSSRSKVFSAMFTHDMQENSENLIKIEDMGGDVMREMLRFIYVGKVQDIDKYTIELLAVAEKYEVKDLKDLCENELIKGVNLENFRMFFELADLYRAQKLKKYLLEFLYKQAEECSRIMSNRQS